MRKYHVTLNKSFPTAKTRIKNTAIHMVNSYYRFQFKRLRSAFTSPPVPERVELLSDLSQRN